MFLPVCQSFCPQGDVSHHALGQGVLPTCTWAGGVSQHASVQGGVWTGGVHPPPETAPEADGTHSYILDAYLNNDSFYIFLTNFNNNGIF